MIKKDLADMKKHLKAEDTMLQLREKYSIYLKKDNLVIVHKEKALFDALDAETQEIYHKNFKKLLSGALDTKLFELSFQNTEEENNTQKLLYSSLETANGEAWNEGLDALVDKLSQCYPYEHDVVITFVKGQYWKGHSKRSKEADEAEDDVVTAFSFILGSINKVEHPKKALQFDYEERIFRMNSALDAVINLNSPVDGFMFPCFNNQAADVNHMMYYTSNTKEVQLPLIENVLNCEWKITAEEEKNQFDSILKAMAGETIKPEVMQSVYEKLAVMEEEAEEGETSTVSMGDIEKVLVESGIEVKEASELEQIYAETTGSTGFEFKVANIVPDLNSKSIKIESETANISLSPKALSSIRQIRDKRGNKCLLIELTDDIQINGIELETVSADEV